MIVLTIMVVIGVINSNNLWLYLALGLAATGAVLRSAQEQVQKQNAAAETTNAVNDFLKAIQAKLN